MVLDLAFLLSTVLVPSDTGVAEAEGPVVLPFLAKIDGSDRIRISREGAEWTHLHWGFPEGPVLLNDIPWFPQAGPRLANHGASRFLPIDVDFESAELRRLAGRDSVVLERGADAITIHLADTPVGAGIYQFDIVFPTARPSVDLRVSARVDGSDEVRISDSGAEWIHHQGGWPEWRVELNDLLWLPRSQGLLPNSAGKRFLPDDVDYSSAEVVSRAGRDLVALEKRKDGISIRFADTPNGSDIYEIVVRFRRMLPSPASDSPSTSRRRP